MQKKCKSKLNISVGVQKRCIVRIVRYNDGKPGGADQVNRPQLVLFVQTRKRFVQQNDVARKRKRSCEGNTLLLPARKRTCAKVHLPRHIQVGQKTLRRFTVGNDRNIFERGKAIQKPRFLKNDGHLAVFKPDDGAEVRLLQTA